MLQTNEELLKVNKRDSRRRMISNTQPTIEARGFPRLDQKNVKLRKILKLILLILIPIIIISIIVVIIIKYTKKKI